MQPIPIHTYTVCYIFTFFFFVSYKIYLQRKKKKRLYREVLWKKFGNFHFPILIQKIANHVSRCTKLFPPSGFVCFCVCPWTGARVYRESRIFGKVTRKALLRQVPFKLLAVSSRASDYSIASYSLNNSRQSQLFARDVLRSYMQQFGGWKKSRGRNKQPDIHPAKHICRDRTV